MIGTIVTGRRAGGDFNVTDPRATSQELAALLRNHTRAFLELSTTHISKRTLEAALSGAIPWAETPPTDTGFILASNGLADDVVGYEDLWATVLFANRHGFRFIIFDVDIPPFAPDLAGLSTFDHSDETPEPDFAPSTTNASLAKALSNFLERRGQALSRLDYSALDEAATRIGERPDEDD